MSNFNEQAAVVTGGGTGIGASIAEGLAKLGARVLVAGRREEPLRKLSEAHPDRISFIQADVTKAEDRKKMIQKAADTYGRIDLLVNNAGSFIHKPLTETTDEEMAFMLNLNINSVLSTIREGIPHLAKTKGSILNVSSIVGRTAMPGTSAYAASKSAVDQLTRVLAAELGPLGIRVNAIAPGATRTEMAAGMLSDPETVKMMESQTPLGRLGEPEDIAGAAISLMSSESAWVTGQIVEASGGMML